MRKSLILVFILVSVIFTPILQVEADQTSQNHNGYTTFSWTGTATTVELTGEWNWSNTNSLIEDNGVWTTELNLSEGMYCYKFIVDGEFIFDPNNSYRGYCGDYENSIVRVKDPVRPTFTINLEDDLLIVTYVPGIEGAGPDGTPSDLSEAIWDSDLMQWSLDISNLEDGKHTLHIEVNDTNGNSAYDELVPFWRGEQADFSWEDSLIYMIMTDRFINGNSSNDPVETGAAQGADWHGGDFEGVTQKIESGYFSEMGVNVLWLTPFNTGANGTGKAADGIHDVSSFHGYWPVEPRQVDPRLGTAEQLKTMVEKAHESGIRIMMDYVINHVHEDHTYYQNNSDWFNQGCICGTESCDWTENRLDCQFTSYLPDVNWKNRNASEQFIEDALWWLEEFDLDGMRVDAVKHVDDLAITNLVLNVNERFETVGTDYYLKGETAMGWDGHSLEENQDQYGTINQYMGEDRLDGQADFVLYHAVVDNVFTTGNMDYSHLDYWTNRSQDQYTPDSIMVEFVGSHDVPRFVSRADPGTTDEWNQWIEDGLPGQPGTDDPYFAALQAHGWLLSIPGAAMIYMGDEYGEFGGADPDNRHSFRESTTWNERERSLQENISKLGQLRLQSDALRRGTYESLYNSPDVLVFERATEKSSALVVLNRGESNDSISLNLANYTNAFGSANILEGLLTIPSNSVSVLIRENNSSNESEIIEEPEIIIGCTDINATNYDVNAEEDDGNCTYEDDIINDNDNNNIENNTTNSTNTTTDENNTLENSSDDDSSQEECEEAGGIWNGDWEECNEEDNQICTIEDENGLIIDCEDYNEKLTFMPKRIIVKNILLISVILASIVLFVISRKNKVV
ncbi:MAG: Cyclomaltodextrin glucanotransferase [Methanobacteriota archaeon]|nr:MAG: Cyclomaltodextrin glucanotransferase [Euryarchaeota archaeon]